MPASQNIQKLIQTPTVTADAKVGLVALYGLRYNKHPSNALPMLLDLLVAAGGVSSREADRAAKVLTYHQSLQSSPSAAGGIADIFQSAGIFSGATSRFKGLQGVENVYTQHTSLLESTLQSLIKGRLKEQQYPFLEGAGASRDKPQDIVVFIVGGATYQEAKMVAGLNAAAAGVRIVLGGTSVHNAASFLDEVDEAVSGWPEARPRR